MEREREFRVPGVPVDVVTSRDVPAGTAYLMGGELLLRPEDAADPVKVREWYDELAATTARVDGIGSDAAS